MLVLTRKVGEKINIGDDVVVSIVEIGRGKVRIGVEAPRQVSILRQEVYENIQEENLMSSRGGSTDVAALARLLRDKELKE